MSPLDAAKKFKDVVSRIYEKPTPGDDIYKKLRNESATVLNLYADDPFNIDILEKCRGLIDRLEKFSLDEIKDYNYERAKSNVVYLAAASKRTNYASYMAGKWASSPDISDEVKVWMHNSAADGAIVLYESLSFIRNYLSKQNNRNKNAKHALDIVNIYRDGSFIDARQFLFFADEIVLNCSITQYNSAKIMAYSADTLVDVKHAIQILENITPVNLDSYHAAEIYWHIDNFNMFNSKDKQLKKVIEKYADDKSAVDVIYRSLQKNYNIAHQIQDERGEGIWEKTNNSRKSKTLAVAASVGSLSIISSYAGIDSDMIREAAGWVFDLISSQVDILNAYLDTEMFGGEVKLVSLGGGGLALGGGGLA